LKKAKSFVKLFFFLEIKGSAPIIELYLDFEVIKAIDIYIYIRSTFKKLILLKIKRGYLN